MFSKTDYLMKLKNTGSSNQVVFVSVHIVSSLGLAPRTKAWLFQGKQKKPENPLQCEEEARPFEENVNGGGDEINRKLENKRSAG